MSLQGRRALVTGGGRGIGAEVARLLAAGGASVMVAARSEDEIGAVAEELRSSGAEAFAQPCDVADEGQVAELARRAREALGGVDVLVNNAGMARSAKLESITLDDWNRIFAVNVTGTFLCTRAMLPGMLEAGWGRVINVASIAGKMGAAYITAYSASKHAVVGFTRSLAVEVATAGITVNAVCPGYVDTEMTTHSVSRIVAKTGITAEQAHQHLLAQSPQKRLFTAAEVAGLVAFLAGPGAGGINGQAIVLDGGAVQS